MEGIALDKIVQTNRAEAGSSTSFDDVEEPTELIDRLNIKNDKEKFTAVKGVSPN